MVHKHRYKVHQNKWIHRNLPKKRKHLLFQIKGLSQGAKIAIGCGATVAGVAGACLAAPVMLAAAGFGSIGITGSSLAAAYMSSVGTVAAGGMFATLQSAGMAGLGALGLGVAGTVGAAVGGGVGALTALGVKKKLSEKDLRKAFYRNVTSSNEELHYPELKHLVQNDLNVDITDEKLFQAYKDVKKKDDYAPVTVDEFLLMFGFKAESQSDSDRQQEPEIENPEIQETPRERTEDDSPSISELLELFTKYDGDNDGSITYKQFKESLDDLNIDVTLKNMREAYKSVTGSFEKPYKQLHFLEYVSVIRKIE